MLLLIAQKLTTEDSCRHILRLEAHDLTARYQFASNGSAYTVYDIHNPWGFQVGWQNLRLRYCVQILCLCKIECMVL